MVDYLLMASSPKGRRRRAQPFPKMSRGGRRRQEQHSRAEIGEDHGHLRHDRCGRVTLAGTAADRDRDGIRARARSRTEGPLSSKAVSALDRSTATAIRAHALCQWLHFGPGCGRGAQQQPAIRTHRQHDVIGCDHDTPQTRKRHSPCEAPACPAQRLVRAARRSPRCPWQTTRAGCP